MYSRVAQTISLLFALTLVSSNPGLSQISTVHSIRSIANAGEAALQHLNEDGVSVQGAMIYDWSKSTAEDDSGAGFGRYSFDFSVAVKGEGLWGLKQGDGLVRIRNHQSNFGDDFVGAAQLYSNIDARSATTLYEAWVEQRLLSDKIRWKVGKIDANTEFAAVQTASDFLNSSMGFSPTIMEFPTYPDPKLGFTFFFHPTRGNTVGVGVFDTASGGPLSIVEGAHAWNSGQAQNIARVSVGYWRLAGTVSRLDGGVSEQTDGVYSVIERTIWKSAEGARQARSLLLFLQFGTADGTVSAFACHIGGGAVLQGPWGRRGQDSMGTAATWVQLSSQNEQVPSVAGELIIETYYKAVLGKHAAFIQDFQLVHDAAGAHPSSNWPVITPRIVVSF